MVNKKEEKQSNISEEEPKKKKAEEEKPKEESDSAKILSGEKKKNLEIDAEKKEGPKRTGKTEEKKLEKKEEEKKEEEKKPEETEELEKEIQAVSAKDKEIKKMFEAGLHFGHRHSRKHPKMEPFIYGVRNTVDIIDLLQTKEYLKKALDYLKQKKKENALILFVGTKVSARALVKELADEPGIPYVTERWLGGTLTNFKVISQRIKYLKEMEEKREKGELEKYKKKERIVINKKLERIEKKMGGLRNLVKLPDLLFVVDVAKEKLAIKEAKEKGIPIVGICDTDGDPTLVDCPILANDDAISSLKYILDRVKKALKPLNRSETKHEIEAKL